jgi:3-hydroxyisobutyrate dehydrogenase-like beta-hydroxyacid dehydrogenase
MGQVGGTRRPKKRRSPVSQVVSGPVVGVVHPGQMGASVAGALVAQGVRVIWASEGRSDQSYRRAEAVGLEDAFSLERLAAFADIMMCICPPDQASTVARAVAVAGFAGLYVDVNAVAPATARGIQAIVEARGATFVDGDLIGGPARPGGTTRLYLSGPEAAKVAALFLGTDRVQAVTLDGETTTASALKMCYAAWTKTSAALLLAVRGAARAMGVEGALLAEWERSQPDLAARMAAAERAVSKAWRFTGEMREIARAFADADAAGAGFANAAAEVFGALAEFKDTEAFELDAVLTALGPQAAHTPSPN